MIEFDRDKKRAAKLWKGSFFLIAVDFVWNPLEIGKMNCEMQKARVSDFADLIGRFIWYPFV